MNKLNLLKQYIINYNYVKIENMPIGTLYHLVSQYSANVVGRECLYDKAIGVEIIDITNSLNSFTLEKSSDIVNIDKLIFKFNEGTNTSNIIQKMKNINSPILFIIEGGGSKIIELNLNFFLQLSSVVKTSLSDSGNG